MKRLIAVVLLLAASLMVSTLHGLAANAGAKPGARLNGDMNGDGERGIGDAIYYLSWLFQSGPEPVTIDCPEDQSWRIANLYEQLEDANSSYAREYARNERQARQISALLTSLADAQNPDKYIAWLQALSSTPDCIDARFVPRDGGSWSARQCAENPELLERRLLVIRSLAQQQVPDEMIHQELERFGRLFSEGNCFCEWQCDP